jgi:hypothetical protein
MHLGWGVEASFGLPLYLRDHVVAFIRAICPQDPNAVVASAPFLLRRSERKSFCRTKTIDIGVVTLHELHEMSPGGNGMLSIPNNGFAVLVRPHIPSTMTERSSGRPVISPQSTRPLAEVCQLYFSNRSRPG